MNTPMRPPPMPTATLERDNVVPLRQHESFLHAVKAATSEHFSRSHDHETTLELEAAILVVLLGSCEYTRREHFDQVLSIIEQTCERMRLRKTGAVGLALHQLAELHATRRRST